jgi:hypothetical protein
MVRFGVYGLLTQSNESVYDLREARNGGSRRNDEALRVPAQPSRTHVLVPLDSLGEGTSLRANMG